MATTHFERSSVFLVPCFRIVEVPVDTSVLVMMPPNDPEPPQGVANDQAPGGLPSVGGMGLGSRLLGKSRASQSAGQTGFSSSAVVGQRNSPRTQVSAAPVDVLPPSTWKTSQVAPELPLQKNSTSSSANAGETRNQNAIVNRSKAPHLNRVMPLRLVESAMLRGFFICSPLRCGLRPVFVRPLGQMR